MSFDIGDLVGGVQIDLSDAGTALDSLVAQFQDAFDQISQIIDQTSQQIDGLGGGQQTSNGGDVVDVSAVTDSLSQVADAAAQTGDTVTSSFDTAQQQVSDSFDTMASDAQGAMDTIDQSAASSGDTLGGVFGTLVSTTTDLGLAAGTTGGIISGALLGAVEPAKTYADAVEAIIKLTRETPAQVAGLLGGFATAGVGAPQAEATITRLEIRLGALANQQKVLNSTYETNVAKVQDSIKVEQEAINSGNLHGAALEAATQKIEAYQASLQTLSYNLKLHENMMQQLGVTYLDAQGKMLPMAEIIPQIIEGLQKLPSAATAVQYGSALFGRTQYQALMEITGQQFTAGVQSTTNPSDTLTQKQLDTMVKNKQALADLGNTWGIFANNLTSEVIPVINTLVGGLDSILQKFNDLDPSTKTMIEHFLSVGGLFLSLFGGSTLLIKGLDDIGKFAGPLGGIFTKLGSAVGDVLTPIGLLGAALLLWGVSPVQFWNDIKTPIEAVAGFLANIVGFLVNIATTFVPVKLAITGLIGLMASIWLVEKIGGAASWAEDAIKNIAKVSSALTTSLGPTIKNVFQGNGVLGTNVSAANKILDGIQQVIVQAFGPEAEAALKTAGLGGGLPGIGGGAAKDATALTEDAAPEVGMLATLLDPEVMLPVLAGIGISAAVIAAVAWWANQKPTPTSGPADLNAAVAKNPSLLLGQNPQQFSGSVLPESIPNRMGGRVTVTTAETAAQQLSNDQFEALQLKYTEIANALGETLPQWVSIQKSSQQADAVTTAFGGYLPDALNKWENALTNSGTSFTNAAAAADAIQGYIKTAGYPTQNAMTGLEFSATNTEQSAKSIAQDTATLATFVHKNGPLTAAELAAWETTITDSHGSGAFVAADMKTLSAFMAKHGPLTASELQGYQDAVASSHGNSQLVANWMSVLSSWVTAHGPLTLAQEQAFENDIANNAGTAFNINLSLKSIYDKLAPAIPYAQAFADNLKNGMKLPAAIIAARGFSGGGGITMATGGLITEHIYGFGASTGRPYEFGENGIETVTPGDARSSGNGWTMYNQFNMVGADPQQISNELGWLMKTNIR